ncbi:MAG TPA: hypothetical protein PLB10_07930 [Thiolinea sp.]|nr:hypothetical protein [Thiolinea sp.]
MRFNGLAIILLTSSLLTACGNGSNNTTDNTNTDDDLNLPAGTGKLFIPDPLDPSVRLPLLDIAYNTTPAVQQRSDQTDTDGQFGYQDAETVTFHILDKQFGPVAAKKLINHQDLAHAFCLDSETPVRCEDAVAKNLQRLLLSADDDQHKDTGIRLMPELSRFPAGLDDAIDSFEAALATQLAPYGRQSAALFSPSLGINLEAPQPEADEVGGQPVAFVDLFRIARPFRELSCTDIEYDANGWPIRIPASCATQDSPIFKVPVYATTLMLRYVPYGAIPTGKYTVLYDGIGTLQYSGIAQKVPVESASGRDVIEITPELIRTRNNAGLRLQLKDTDSNDPLRNIRIIMPGGICEANPFIRVNADTGCPDGSYRSFVSLLEQDRNTIVFNPDYLRFLKDFKVIRTMNFMEASPRNPCYTLQDEAYIECLLQDFSWSQRAKIDQASWGGSARTPLLERYGRGVPPEVIIELANTLKRDPWFNLPHNATDDYVKRFATLVRDRLDPTLKAYVEYTNEPWNGIFWGALYVREKGKALDDNPYRAGYKYYSHRAVEIFNIWHDVFGGAERLVRILNTFHPDEYMSRNMLNYEGNAQYVDAIASAPYFYACWDRTHIKCQDETKVPMVLKEVSSVDDIFRLIDNPDDPYGIDSTIAQMKKQAEAVKELGARYLTYEGGQHLIVPTEYWADKEVPVNIKNSLLDLIRATNRDPRMGTRYTRFLNGWKDSGGELFTLYTLPQTWHKFGTFGIKEHLGQPRLNAPKYDAAMKFQEAQGKCWWENC